MYFTFIFEIDIDGSVSTISNLLVLFFAIE